MQQMTYRHTGNRETRKVRTPFWRRITALFTLGSIVVVGGLALAAMITLTVVMLIFLIERAIA
jgi:hypothetical protein